MCDIINKPQTLAVANHEAFVTLLVNVRRFLNIPRDSTEILKETSISLDLFWALRLVLPRLYL